MELDSKNYKIGGEDWVWNRSNINSNLKKVTDNSNYYNLKH